MKLKQLTLTPLLIVLFAMMLQFVVISSSSAQSKIIEDPTEDFNFETIKFSDILKIKTLHDESDLQGFDQYLTTKGIQQQSAGNSYQTSFGLKFTFIDSGKLPADLLGFTESEATVLLISCDSKGFDEQLTQFIRSQKCNDNLFYDQVDDELIKFSTLDKELKLCVFQAGDKKSLVIF
ncbi:hypothetical protein C8P68_101379 [Mucilaginibacter yixingensis]|uniref:Uncharacterized protein n=1 Tax=Mucilaginibacter yixingensis TaxID=1295612 RepID=A0A2T5JFL5_9SPHI|nr:hypothetical protein [Mucilaginibacter yixingensis]PTR01146.1 hypothetical protein C8P68_101379 [Mucilaginibacter yixingensis]